MSTRKTDHKHIVDLLRKYKADLASRLKAKDSKTIARLKAAYDDLVSTHIRADIASAPFLERSKNVRPTSSISVFPSSGVDAELLRELGEQLMFDQLAGAPSRPSVFVDKAKQWLDAKYHEIRSLLCPHQARISLLLEKDTTDAVSAVADLLVGLATGVTPVTVSKICLNVGGEIAPLN